MNNANNGQLAPPPPPPPFLYEKTLSLSDVDPDRCSVWLTKSFKSTVLCRPRRRNLVLNGTGIEIRVWRLRRRRNEEVSYLLTMKKWPARQNIVLEGDQWNLLVAENDLEYGDTFGLTFVDGNLHFGVVKGIRRLMRNNNN